MATVNATEQFVLDICEKSFLSLWCYNNPRRQDQKELCDILVVCEPHVVIISVKDIAYKDTGNYPVDSSRWERRAVDGSLRQIKGAERWLQTATQVIRNDGAPGLDLPPLATMKIHRIAVAFGASEDGVIIKSGDFGNGYVNVMTDESFREVLTELDTITDFVNYLEAKETRLANGSSAVILGSEANLLGWYLQNGRSFPSGYTAMMIDDSIWEGLQDSADFKRRKEADRQSYLWDELIESFSFRLLNSSSTPDPQFSDVEKVLRIMARENRFVRRVLARGFSDFVAKRDRLRSRLLASEESPVVYVLVSFRDDEDRDKRNYELCDRCLSARAAIKHGEVFIGVGITSDAQEGWIASDIACLDTREWSADDATQADQQQTELRYYKNAPQRFDEHEYPAVEKS